MTVLWSCSNEAAFVVVTPWWTVAEICELIGIADWGGHSRYQKKEPLNLLEMFGRRRRFPLTPTP